MFTGKTFQIKLLFAILWKYSKEMESQCISSGVTKNIVFIVNFTFFIASDLLVFTHYENQYMKGIKNGNGSPTNEVIMIVNPFR